MTNLIDFRVTDLVDQVLAVQYNRVIDAAIRGELSNSETLSANKTLLDADYALQIYATSAARDVTLPAVASGNHPFYIVNTSTTHSLTVKNAGGTTIGIVTPSSAAAFGSSGAAWYVLGTDVNVHAAASKTTPVDADEVKLLDSAASFGVKRLSWANIKATLKTYLDALYPSTTGWVSDPNTWTYASASTFTVAGDQTDIYAPGTRVMWTQTTVKYGTVSSSSYSEPNTTVNLIVNISYSVTNAVISGQAYSYFESPLGYPGSFRWSPTFTGFSVDPVSAVYVFVPHINGVIELQIRQGFNGTSNATSFTFTLPSRARNLSGMSWVGSAQVLDNSVLLTTPGLISISANSTTASVLPGYGSAVWTASGGKRLSAGNISYLYF